MYKITETELKEMPEDLQSLYTKLPNESREEVVGLFPAKAGKIGMKGKTGHNNNIYGKFGHQTDRTAGTTDHGSAARFFYCAKASKKDRGDNKHPTVKPTDLMRYLCRLVTPKGGTILDPFMGSGSTGKGAAKEGFNFIGIELDEEYVKIAEKRIADVV